MLKRQNQHCKLQYINEYRHLKLLHIFMVAYILLQTLEKDTVGTTIGFINQRSINFPKIYESTQNCRHHCTKSCCHGSLKPGTWAQLPYTHLTVCVGPKPYGQHNIPTASSVLPQVLALFFTCQQATDSTTS